MCSPLILSNIYLHWKLESIEADARRPVSNENGQTFTMNRNQTLKNVRFMFSNAHTSISTCYITRYTHIHTDTLPHHYVNSPWHGPLAKSKTLASCIEIDTQWCSCTSPEAMRYAQVAHPQTNAAINKDTKIGFVHHIPQQDHYSHFPENWVR